VEDDPDLRSMYRTSLSVAGFTVIAVGDGIEALRYLDAEAPYAVVLDLGLPRLGGLDVREEIAAHAETRDIPIVVVTGSDTSLLRDDDFACILKKPIDPEDVVQAVRRCLRKFGRTV
jgi:two-component system, OmpR family, response regulator MprA